MLTDKQLRKTIKDQVDYVREVFARDGRALKDEDIILLAFEATEKEYKNRLADKLLGEPLG